MRNVTADYISHGEIQDGRAYDPVHWSPHLETLLTQSFAAAIPRPDEEPSSLRIAAARVGGVLAGMAYAEFRPNAEPPFAILHDLVVDAAFRGKGIGGKMLDWFDAQARESGIQHIFLENGVRATRACALFTRHGYRLVSRVLIKSINL